MSEKDKKACRDLNYFHHFLVFISAVSGCVSISAFDLLVSVSLGIASSAVELNICAIIQKLKVLGQLSRKRGKSMIK